jgi:hypothetical protein
MINQNEVNLIAKVVFSCSASREIRKFNVHDKDYQQFVALVSDSLKSFVDDDELQLQYLDSENDWVTFSSDNEWSEAKQQCTCSKMMKVKVKVSENNFKQHCSLNLRGGKKRRSAGSKQYHSAPSGLFEKPDRQHLTVGYSFEEFRKQMEAMSQCNDQTTTECPETKKRRQKKRLPTDRKKSSGSRKARKTESESEAPSIVCSEDSFFTMMLDSDSDSSVVC